MMGPKSQTRDGQLYSLDYVSFSGFSTALVALCTSTTSLSRILLSCRYDTNLIGGAIVILFGSFPTGVFPMPWIEHDVRYHGQLQGGKLVGTYVLGLAFGFGWSLCIGQVLGAILTVSSISTK